jgi:mannitol 2-dehydrogenase
LIVHFGAGNFHRAHQAAYLDALADVAWTICAVGTRDADAPLRDAMRANDCRNTLRLVSDDGAVDARVISAIREYLLATDDAGALAARLVDPATRIVSLTITEGGYVDNDELFAQIAGALLLRRDRASPPSPSCRATTWRITVTWRAAPCATPPRPWRRRRGSTSTSRSRMRWSTASRRRRPTRWW